MHPEPYFDKEKWNKLRKEIERDGFEPDTILPIQPDRPVYGLNITMGWPLPAPLKEPYEKLFHELSTLGPDIYVYPYEQTHITVMTLVNFKNHQYPGKDVNEIKRLVPEIISLVSQGLSALEQEFKPFSINVGPPVLAKSAAFLPILNATNEVCLLRKKIAPVLGDSLSLKVEIPRAVHSTIVRFVKRPDNVSKFMAKFESITANTHLGEATITEFLLTSETKPYMRGGEKLHVFQLGD